MADTRMMPKTTGRSTGIGPTRTVVPSSAGAGTNGLTMAPSARALPPQRRQDAQVQIIDRSAQQVNQPMGQGSIARSVTILSGPGVAPGQGQIEPVAQVGYAIPDDQRQLVLALLERYAASADEQQANLARSAAINLEKILVGHQVNQRQAQPQPQHQAAPAIRPQQIPAGTSGIPKVFATTTTTIISGPNAGTVVDTTPRTAVVPNQYATEPQIAAPPAPTPQPQSAPQSIEDQGNAFFQKISADFGAHAIVPNAASVSTIDSGTENQPQ